VRPAYDEQQQRHDGPDQRPLADLQGDVVASWLRQRFAQVQRA
jgi:hypothetical protein